MPLPPFTAPSTKPGLGAVLQDAGCSYRVWAPNATGVTLGGDFFHAGNLESIAWQELPMARDADSGESAAFWSIFVPGALADSLYKFKLQNPAPAPNLGPSWPYRHDPYARDATSFAGNSVVVDRSFDWSQDSFGMPSWNQLVIYELHVGTFNRNSPTQIGTFDEATAKLDYIRGLGFNAVQVMPAFDFDTTTSMGYNPALPFAIDNAYGRLNAMKSFILAAHQARLAVILDVVYNHFGPQGLDVCLNTFDGTSNPGYAGIYFYQDGRIHTPYGDSRPDFGRGEIRQYLCDNAMTWLGELHCDGLRFDSTVGIRRVIGGYGTDDGPNEDGRTLLRYLGEQKRAAFPWKILIAEDLQNDATVTQDALFGGVGLDSQWDNWFLGRLQNMMFATDDASRAPQEVAAAITKNYNDAGAFQRVIYLESHDQAYQQRRLPDRIDLGNAGGYFARKRSTLGAAILMSSPGIPMIFMGQEFLEYAPWNDGLGYSLDWSRAGTFSGIVDLYRRLVQLRRNFDNNTRGLSGNNTDLYWIDPAGVIAYRRFESGGPGDDVIVVANLSNRSYPSYNVGFPRGGMWYLRFNSDWSAYSADFGNVGYDTTADGGSNMGQPCSGNVGLGAYSTVMYSQ
jgi:1,4-alpha-glucan branching enzyme